MHPEFAHRLGEAGRIGEVEEHHDHPPPGRAMIGSQKNARQKLAADQPLDLGHYSDNYRECEARRDDLGQIDRQPGFLDVPVEDELKRNSDDGQRGGHHERAEHDVGRERQTSERGADGEARPIRRLHGPDRQAQAGPVQSASKVICEISFGGLVDQEAIAEADDEPAEQVSGEVARPLRGPPQENRSADPAFGVASEHDRLLSAPHGQVESCDKVITAPTRRRDASRCLDAAELRNHRLRK